MQSRWFVAALLLAVSCPVAEARTLRNFFRLGRTNRHLAGHIDDYTNNHGRDRRIWSEALGKRRDLYVYLPPGYDPRQRYPLVLWLHGIAQDEASFLETVAPLLDKAIRCGKLPPVIIAAPDGSIYGRGCYFSVGSFFLNSEAGRFEDYLMRDVWNFLHAHYPIRPEREAHVLAGASMGGGAAFNKGFKYRDRVGIVLGIAPPLNSRWVDCHGNYRGNFDPHCWGWRTDYSRRFEVVARFFGVFTVRLGQVLRPLYGWNNPLVNELVSSENPIEMLWTYNVQPGQLSMFIAYGGKDQFNMDAQVESFLYVARRRGLDITVAYDPDGRHDLRTAVSFVPAILDWLTPQLAPYSPPLRK